MDRHKMGSMALSDDLLARPETLSAVREHIRSLVEETDANAGFLVDEQGTPFATVGHVEFDFPHPLPNLRAGTAILEALVGEAPSTDEPGASFVVERAGKRAFLTVLLGSPPPRLQQRAIRRRVRKCAREIAGLL